jgi:hypothetical protein
LPEYPINNLQQLAHQHGLVMEQQGAKLYLRSLQGYTFIGGTIVRIASTNPTNHLPSSTELD